MNIGTLLQDLEARLPELEWRMGALGASLNEQVLPKGLFRSCFHPKPAFYIQEIKNDIHALATQDSLKSAEYLAKRIHQKINVLITLCRTQKIDPKIQRPLYAMTSIMSSRKQRVEALEQEINALSLQENAMENTLQKLQKNGDMQALLLLQKELGLVKKQLTLAKENLLKI